MSAYNLSTRMYFTVISDEQLDEIVGEIQEDLQLYGIYTYSCMELMGMLQCLQTMEMWNL